MAHIRFYGYKLKTELVWHTLYEIYFFTIFSFLLYYCSPGVFGEYLKSMVYGGMDGIITTFAIVCAASGANKDDATIVTMGVANLIADAISMGMGDYISDKAEQVQK